MMTMAFTVFGIIWLVLGFIIHIMAGLTHDWEKRFFRAYWLIPFGPLAIIIWLMLEEWEARKEK